MRAYAGRPQRVQYLSSDGFVVRSAAGAGWETLEYNLSDHGLKGTFYSLWRSKSGWVLEQFSSTLARWRTPAGTRVGMGYGQAAKRERVGFQGGCMFAGLVHSQLKPAFFEYGADIHPGPAGNVSAGYVDALFAEGPHPLFC